MTDPWLETGCGRDVPDDRDGMRTCQGNLTQSRRWGCVRSTSAKDSDLALIGLRTRVFAVMP
jgi:hypothetical protein